LRFAEAVARPIGRTRRSADGGRWLRHLRFPAALCSGSRSFTDTATPVFPRRDPGEGRRPCSRSRGRPTRRRHGDRLGAVDAVKRKLVKQLDLAAAKLVTALEELSKIY
jgi:hypothetical protein